MSRCILSVDCGLKNLGLCVFRADDTILQWALVETLPQPIALKKSFERETREWVYDEAIIERQPIQNSSMKRMEHYLEMLLISKNVPTTIVDAKNKLSFASTLPYWPLNLPAKLNYNQRKKASVETVRAFLNATHQAGFLEFFESTKKKDDLSDAVLQAMAFLEKRKSTSSSN